MFSQACVTCSVQLGGGVTPNASWDRSQVGEGEGGGQRSIPPGQGPPPPPRQGPPPPPKKKQGPPPWTGTTIPTPWTKTNTPFLQTETTTPPGQGPTPPPPPGRTTTSSPQHTYRNHGQWAVDRHPTGMHSCFPMIIDEIGNNKKHGLD